MKNHFSNLKDCLKLTWLLHQEDLNPLMAMPIWLREKLFQKRNIFNFLKQHDPNFESIEKIKFSEHHFSLSATSAFFPSPFKEALILTLDGVGEWPTSTLALGKENKVEILKEIPSLILLDFFTLHLLTI